MTNWFERNLSITARNSSAVVSNDQVTLTSVTESQSQALCSSIELQANHVRAPYKHVENTLYRPLLVANHDHKHSGTRQMFDRDHIRSAQNYLIYYSAHCFSPVFGSLNGLGTEPFAWYSFIVGDLLHVFDHRNASLILDNAYIKMETRVYNKGMKSKAVLIRMANQRFTYMARAFGITIELFHVLDGEVDAGMTGLRHRLMVPFI